MKTAGALLTLLLITVIPGMAGNEADADRGKLIALENAWNQAQMTKDVSGVEQLLAPMFIYTDYDGVVQDKKQFLDDLKDPAYRATSMINDDAQVFPYHNAAVVVGTYHTKGTYKGKAFEHRGRFTDTVSGWQVGVRGVAHKFDKGITKIPNGHEKRADKNVRPNVTEILRARAPRDFAQGRSAPDNLLFLFFGLRLLSTGLRLLLGFGFFHRLAGLFGFLGSGFGTLLALFIQHLLTLEQFDEGFIGTVTFLPHGADNASVATLAIPETRADGVEKFADRFIGHQVGGGLPPGGEISALAERDHLFDGWAQRLGFRNRGFDALFHDERSHHVPQQRAAVRCGTSEFVSSNFVTHF